MSIIESPAYQKAFIQYLRKGTAIGVSLKAEADSQPTLYYIWRTRGDNKVRASHADNNGKVFRWDNPPPTGNPGEDFGCRCVALPIPENKPLVLEGSDIHVTTYYPDGSSQTRIGGSRAWRNNNPGNLRTGTFADRHGAIGSAGGFAVFPNEAAGQRASIALLRTPSYTGLTVDQAIARRSPTNENDTIRLQQIIRDIGGFSGQEIVGLLTNAQLNRLASAIQRTEGWLPGKILQTAPPQ